MHLPSGDWRNRPTGDRRVKSHPTTRIENKMLDKERNTLGNVHLAKTIPTLSHESATNTKYAFLLYPQL
jgi:hypothetical protein